MNNKKIVIPGGAGLVGQNLIVCLKEHGFTNIHIIDKHKKNMKILRKLHPDVNAHYYDLSQNDESWKECFNDVDYIIMLQAQIGGIKENEFSDNNVNSTKNILQVISNFSKIPNLIHISSSVVNSKADDFYSKSKREQEELVINSGIPCHILRPTLMFGWFDRKHLGWLSRFMSKVPIFPIPGSGKYMRQPLYVGDFCKIIIKCIESDIPKKIYNISGHEKIYYIDIIRSLKEINHSRTIILNIPYWLFSILLKIWSIFDKNPPFTNQQLEALVIEEEFEIIDWPTVFSIEFTPFFEAATVTFTHPIYSKIEMEF
tara:strand:- start:4918 stop:5862 length:945 start_codon:yes stop_codon:yes gene_type:complete